MRWTSSYKATRAALVVILVTVAAAIILGGRTRDAGASHVAPGATLFQDDFQRPDSGTPGPRWREYTLRNEQASIADSPWCVRGGSLYFEYTAMNSYIEDFVETVETFPVDGVRVEFDMRARVGTSRGYVGPTMWWSWDAAARGSSANVRTGPAHLGVAASYRWENAGTRGMYASVGGGKNVDFPAFAVPGINDPNFAHHSITIQDGILTYEAQGANVFKLPLGETLPPGAQRHWTFGARTYDAAVPQVIEIRNLRITSLR